MPVRKRTWVFVCVCCVSVCCGDHLCEFAMMCQVWMPLPETFCECYVCVCVYCVCEAHSA